MAAQWLPGTPWAKSDHLPREFKALSVIQKNNPTKCQVTLQVLLHRISGLNGSTVYLK